MAIAVQNWTRVSRKAPCPICQKFKGCVVHVDQSKAICIRHASDHAVTSGLGGWLHSLLDYSVQPLRVEPLVLPSSRRAQPAQLHRVYRALLAEHPLQPVHLQHLQSVRQLSPEAIAERGYASWGFFRYQRSSIAKNVFENLGAIALDTPGVIQREQKGTYLTLAGAPGIAIPVRNADGQIVGMQIRVDDPKVGGKYQWLSSTSRGGPGPGTPIHVARPRNGCQSRRVWLTEGPLKADIACERLGEIVLALPGIQALKEYPATLEQLQSRGEIRELVIAMDSDWHSKPQVAKARLLVAERAARQGLMVWLADWTQNCKGLDDLLLAGGRPKLEAYRVQGNGPRAVQPTEGNRATRRGFKGLTLKEAREYQTRELNAFLDAPRDGKDRGVLLNALPGAGKSYALTESLNRLVAKRHRANATVFVSRHDLAGGADRQDWAMTRGRSHTSASHKIPPCHQTAAQSRLSNLRIPAQMGCERCPLLENCRSNRSLDARDPFYLAQFHQRARISVHPMQHFMVSSMFEHSRVIALDDCDLKSLCLETIDLSRSQLEKALDWAENHKHAYQEAQPLLHLLVELARLAPAGSFSVQGGKLFDDLVALSEERGMELEEVLEQARKAKEPDPFGNDDLVCARLDVPMRFLDELIEILSFELKAYRTRDEREYESWNVRLRLERTYAGEDVRLSLKCRRSLPLEALKGKDIIISDASLTLEEARQLFPDRHWIQINPTVRMPDTVNIVQFADQAWGKIRLLDPRAQEQALARIAAIVERHPFEKIALITHKSFSTIVATRFPNIQVGHFFGQRGSNEFAKCDVQIVFGTPYPNPEEILRQAQALHWDENTVLPHDLLQSRTFQTTPGSSGYQVATRTFADPRLASLLRAKIEDELIQAIYRIRPLSVSHDALQGLLPFADNPEQPRSKATVYVFSSRPLPGLDVTVCLEPKTPAPVIDFQAAARSVHARRLVVSEERLAHEVRQTCHQVRRWKACAPGTWESGSPSFANPPPEQAATAS